MTSNIPRYRSKSFYFFPILFPLLLPISACLWWLASQAPTLGPWESDSLGGLHGGALSPQRVRAVSKSQDQWARLQPGPLRRLWALGVSMFGDSFSFYLPTYTICLITLASLAWGDFTQYPLVGDKEGQLAMLSWVLLASLPAKDLSGLGTVPLGHRSFAGRLSEPLGLFVSDKGTKEGARYELLSCQIPGAGALHSPSCEALSLPFFLLIQWAAASSCLPGVFEGALGTQTQGLCFSAPKEEVSCILETIPYDKACGCVRASAEWSSWDWFTSQSWQEWRARRGSKTRELVDHFCFFLGGPYLDHWVLLWEPHLKRNLVQRRMCRILTILFDQKDLGAGWVELRWPD